MSYSLKKVAVTTLDQLSEYVTDEEIYAYYLKHSFKPGAKYNSPLPDRDDKDPSFVINYDSLGRLKWVDYGYQPVDKKVPVVDTALGFANLMLGGHISFKKTIQKIYDDIVLGNKGLSRRDIDAIKMSALTGIEDAGITIKSEMSPAELAYWKTYGGYKELLDVYEIYGAESVYFNKRLWRQGTKEDPLFGYIFSREKGRESWQAYRPNSLYPENKFRTHNTSEVIMGLKQLRKSGIKLIITKSMKDIISLRALGFSAIAPMSEKRFLDILPHVNELNTRFDQVYILFDNDPTGVTCSRALNEAVPNWRPFFLNKKYGKDPSQVAEECGPHILKGILQQNL